MQIYSGASGGESQILVLSKDPSLKKLRRDKSTSDTSSVIQQ